MLFLNEIAGNKHLSFHFEKLIKIDRYGNFSTLEK